MSNDATYDVIIAGAGPAGVLAAARLKATTPELRVLLIEKDPWLGGRLRSSSTRAGAWSYGLNTISHKLFDFWDQTLKASPEAPELHEFAKSRQERYGVLFGSKMSEFPTEQLFSIKGARALGGMAAGRGWKQVEELLGAATEDRGAKVFAQAWPGTRKDPAAVVLEQYAACVGIPDLWASNALALKQRADYQLQKPHTGQWETAMQHIIDSLGDLDVRKPCRIIGARREAEQWFIDTEQGEFCGRSLVVAQPPWLALSWLPKSYWPTPVLNLAMKTRPVSVVVLSEVLKQPIDLPDVCIIPSEQVQVLVNKENSEICFQATLDYEMSLNAPTVVKAVKRLRRARKKLLAAYPEMMTEGDHLALLPVAWAQSPIQTDRRYMEKLAKDFNTPTLAFCGDAYGASYDGDENFIASLLGTCNAIALETRSH